MEAADSMAAAAAAAAASSSDMPVEEEAGLVASVYVFLFGTPVNALLTTVCAWLLYRLMRPDAPKSREPVDDFVMPPPLEKHDMSLSELKQYDGRGADGRVCIAIMGKVFDCTRGRKFYGPNGPYCTFAGRDATRALATFDVNAVTEEWDDHKDLTPGQISSVEEWQMQLSERYDFVGELIRPEDQPSSETADQDTGKTTDPTTTAAAGDQEAKD